MGKISEGVIVSLFMGLIASIGVYTNWLDMFFSDITPVLIVGVVGSIISIWLIKESNSKFDRLIAGIGFLLNIFPVGYFILLYIALG